MGLFSWVCKGCGEELCEREWVRLNGCVGEYDGYGRAGGFDYSECDKTPSAWHEACYQKATPEQKLDESPSKHARNQGFGGAHLFYLKDFNPNAKITYSCVVDISFSTVEKLYRYCFCLTKDKGWEDEEAYWEKIRNDETVGISPSDPSRSMEFDTIEEAKAQIVEFLKTRDQDFKEGHYIEGRIYGTQDILVGRIATVRLYPPESEVSA